MNKITFEEDKDTRELWEWVSKALDVIGHPEAWVSDRSIIWDFCVDGRDKHEYALELSERFGFRVWRNTYIVDIAREMKRLNG